MLIKKVGLVLAAVLLSGAALAAQLTAEQQAAKEKGITLYNQYKAISAVPYLEEAAKAGDRESQYYLGEALRSSNRFMTAEAKKWFMASAEQGDIYSMLRLSRSSNDLCSAMANCPPDSKSDWDWLKQARDQANARAEAGDAEAMYILYLATSELEWLEKSAAAGYAQGQYLLANRYLEGKGVFFPPWNRSEKVKDLLKSSAEGGFVKAMLQYPEILGASGSNEEIRYWAEKAVAAGSVDAIYGYGSFLAHEPEGYGVKLDLVKAYGFIYMLKDLDGGGGLQEDVSYKLPIIAAKMTPEQMEEAKKFAQEWKANHPPLSFFPDKLGF